jgi:hypothetical protein
MDINRGDRFDYLVSMSGPSRGLQDWAKEHTPADSPKRNEKYVLGDINCSLIKTARGRTILVEHNTNLPRPYSRIHLVEGTKGLFQGYPSRVYIEGRGKEDEWQDAAALLEEFEHPLWKEIAAIAKGAGHGGMDFIEDYRLIKCLREGQPTDMNVYDAAGLSAVVHLSVQSVAKKSAAVDFPDFTKVAGSTRRRCRSFTCKRIGGVTHTSRAVVLARGLGTRMREADPAVTLTPEQQRSADAGLKPMVPVNGRPFLEYVFGAIADAGLRHVALIVAPDHQVIRGHFEEHAPSRLSISYLVQPEPLGTANAVLAAEPWTDSAPFLVMNADNLYPPRALADLASLDEPGLLAFEADDLVRTGNIPAERVQAFAIGEADDDGFLERIVEKPKELLPGGPTRTTQFVSMNCWRFDTRSSAHAAMCLVLRAESSSCPTRSRCRWRAAFASGRSGRVGQYSIFRAAPT